VRDNAWHVGTLAPHAAAHARGLLVAFPALVVSSSYRSPVVNRLVGGAPRSVHTRRRAIDVTGPAWLLRQAATWARHQRVSASCTGPEEVLLEYMGTRRQHLHLAW
jgi:uncharacterized protein YcbK (DUF882 family)